MLFPLLIGLLVAATLALFAIGGILIHQQRLEQAERRSVAHDGPATVTLGGLGGDFSARIDHHALAKLQLELQTERQMAEIIG